MLFHDLSFTGNEIYRRDKLYIVVRLWKLQLAFVFFLKTDTGQCLQKRQKKSVTVMKQRFLKTEILALLFTLVTLLFLSGCSERTVTVIEDLSLSAPTTFVPLDESTDLGSSYVKMNNATEDTEATEQNTETPEEVSETEIADELTAQEQDALDKRVYREGDFIAFDPIGLDPDGDVITYSYSRPLDEKGEWQTGI